MNNILTVSRLCKAYDSFALRDVSFDLRPGAITGFIGRNGAGKTTTLKCLLHFVQPDSGDIAFFGLPIGGRELAIKRRIGFVSGGVDFYPRRKLRTITAVTRRFYKGWDAEAYRRYCKRFELDENKTPAQLSAGMKVKYSLALALSHRAELLILDEPTSGLDPVSREDLLEVFLTLAGEGITILFSTHITSDLEKCADELLYLRGGKMVGRGGLDAFREQYRLVRLTAQQAAAAPPGRFIGVRPDRAGCTALIRAEAAGEVGLPSEPAGLEAVMVHLEKEEER